MSAIVKQDVDTAFQQILARTPDPETFALVFPEQMAQAIETAKTPEDANMLRALVDMGYAYLRQTLPKVIQDRRECYRLMFPTEEAVIDAAGRAGVLWDAMENKAGPGGDKGKNQYSEWHSENSPNGTSATDNGFRDSRDATTCVRIGRLDQQDKAIYKNECRQNYRNMTVSGAERVWRLLNPKPAIDLPDGMYRVVYADPPWKYGNVMPDEFHEQADHYELMTVQQICEMPVKKMVGDNAVLFLWVTSPILEESFQVVKAWGFEYKSSFVWDKVKHVMGHYNSVRHEILLVCTRGSCQPDVQKLFDSVYTEERTEHSAKPEYFRNVIDTIYQDGPRIELFARSEHDGWEVWGNDVA